MELDLPFDKGDKVWVNNKYLKYDDQPGEVKNIKVEVTYDVKLESGDYVNASVMSLENLSQKNKQKEGG